MVINWSYLLMWTLCCCVSQRCDESASACKIVKTSPTNFSETICTRLCNEASSCLIYFRCHYGQVKTHTLTINLGNEQNNTCFSVVISLQKKTKNKKQKTFSRSITSSLLIEVRVNLGEHRIYYCDWKSFSFLEKHIKRKGTNDGMEKVITNVSSSSSSM